MVSRAKGPANTRNYIVARLHEDPSAFSHDTPAARELSVLGRNADAGVENLEAQGRIRGARAAHRYEPFPCVLDRIRDEVAQNLLDEGRIAVGEFRPVGCLRVRARTNLLMRIYPLRVLSAHALKGPIRTWCVD